MKNKKPRCAVERILQQIETDQATLPMILCGGGVHDHETKSLYLGQLIGELANSLREKPENKTHQTAQVHRLLSFCYGWLVANKTTDLLDKLVLTSKEGLDGPIFPNVFFLSGIIASSTLVQMEWIEWGLVRTSARCINWLVALESDSTKTKPSTKD